MNHGNRMITEIRINGTTADLPEEALTINLEEISPLQSTTLTVGDFAQSFSIPGSPKNRRLFNFPERLELNERSIQFENVVIIDKHLGSIRGTLEISEAQNDFGAIEYDCDFFTNLLGIDIFTQKIHEILNGSTSLGATTAAIIAAAKSQNAAAMSTNGTSGALMKFIPHFNRDFYEEDVNQDWNVSAANYDAKRAYSIDDVILFQDARLFDSPQKYICTAAAATLEGPQANPEKWERIPFCVINDWDAANAAFYTNETQKIGSKFFQNFHALAPWLQLHLVVRELAQGIGYTAAGQYLDDPIETRALLASDTSITDLLEYRALLQLNDADDFNGLAVITSFYSLMESIVQPDAADNDENGLFDAAAHSLTVSRKGIYQWRIEGQIWCDENGVDEASVRFAIGEDTSTILAFLDIAFPVGSFPTSAAIPFSAEIIWEYDYSGTDGSVDLDVKLYASTQNTGTDGQVGGVLTFTFMAFENITYQGRDAYGGAVNYADHVPDITAADFLEAIRTHWNLFLHFDGKSRTLRLDYADTILASRNDMIDLDEYSEGGQRTRLIPKRRFEMNFGSLPEGSNQDISGFNLIDPVDKIQDLGPLVLSMNLNPSAKKAVLVRSLNAYLVAGRSDYTNQNAFKLYSQNWPTLKVEADGEELLTIAPQLGPVAMGYFRSQGGEIYQNPLTFGEGRSTGFSSKGERPPFAIAYWIGLDTTTEGDGYPFATTTGRNSAGTSVLSRSMSWADHYPLFWKRTLQTLALEEIITRSFIIPASINQRIQWDRLLLLGHSPMLLLKRLRTLGQAQRQQLEMRKLKRTPIEIVADGVVENIEETPWTPAQISPAYWLDFADESTVTIDASGLIEAISDKTANAGAANQTTAAKRAKYETWPATGLKAYRNDDASLRYLDFALNLQNDQYTIYTVHNVQNNLYSGLIFSRSPALWGVHPRPFTSRYSIFPPQSSAHRYNGIETSSGGLDLDGFFSFETEEEAIASAYSGAIGRDPTYTNRNLQGWIGEIAVFQGTHDDETRQLMEGYLAWKHGMQNNLPAAHPYLGARPIL
jgi:hypothetical protein